MNYSKEILAVASRVVWFEEPEKTLADKKLFLSHVMTYGTMEDVLAVRAVFTDKDFKETLDDPVPGVFDPRSWAYWNTVFGRIPTPPMKTRF